MPKVSVSLSAGEGVVHYDIAGDGPGLVLIHGTAATREQWMPLTEAVQDRFTVVAPDYSGSGLTTDHGGPLTLADLAAEVLAAADDAGLGSFHLVGHSLGAAIATHLAGTHPGRVSSLFLHAGWVKTDVKMDAEFRYWLGLLEHGPAIFARMLPLLAFGPNYWAGTTAEANEALVTQLTGTIAPGADRQIEVDRRVDLTGLLARITAPTIVLASLHDRLIDPAQQRALVAGIEHARYSEIDAGHGAPGEDPAGFIRAVAGFLADNQSSVVSPVST
jgi:pimeloyl-ACP methyl ester carboxylesterase